MAIEILERCSGKSHSRYDIVRCRFEHSQHLLVGKMLRGSAAAERAAFQTERWIGNALQHNSLPRLEGEFILEGRPTLAYREIKGEDLESWLKNRAQQPMKAELGELLVQLVGAMRTLHQAGLVHSQIRPEHILITPAGHLALIGLGGCSGVGDKPIAAATNDPFAASELRTAEDAEACSSADMYSLGKIIAKFFPEFQEVCKVELLCATPEQRPTSSEILELLRTAPRLRTAG